uniref:Uncharacterized protein n=1 Tax=Calidris pygmaea TaxID=425635 RepID=A0A8C3JLA0_9CHAR
HSSTLLSLCAYSRVTSLAMEFGAGVPHVTPVCLGQTWRELPTTLGWLVASSPVTTCTACERQPNNPSLLKTLKKMPVIHLKKQCCCVSMDYEGDLHDLGYHPPEQFCCLELLFQPKDTEGDIALSGGSSMFPGFPERVCLELNTLFHDRVSPESHSSLGGGGLDGTLLMWTGVVVGGQGRSLHMMQESWLLHRSIHQERSTLFLDKTRRKIEPEPPLPSPWCLHAHPGL